MDAEVRERWLGRVRECASAPLVVRAASLGEIPEERLDTRATEALGCLR